MLSLLFHRGPIARSFAIVCGCSLTANLLTDALSGGKAYWETHAWPLALALLTAAPLIHCYRNAVERRAGPMPDPAAAEKARTLKWCALIAAGFGVYVLAANKTPGPAKTTAAPAPTAVTAPAIAPR
jgi:hypothetical protein